MWHFLLGLLIGIIAGFVIGYLVRRKNDNDPKITFKS